MTPILVTQPYLMPTSALVMTTNPSYSCQSYRDLVNPAKFASRLTAGCFCQSAVRNARSYYRTEYQIIPHVHHSPYEAQQQAIPGNWALCQEEWNRLEYCITGPPTECTSTLPP